MQKNKNPPKNPIKKYLEATGLSKQNFAIICGISRSHLYKIINGTFLPHPKTLEKMIKGSNGRIPLEEFIKYARGLDSDRACTYSVDCTRRIRKEKLRQKSEGEGGIPQTDQGAVEG